MDSQEKKKNGGGLTDELDLEPLDFDLELPSLGDDSGMDQEFALPELPEIDTEAADEEADLPADEEGPITLTADELNDIVAADLTGAGPARVVEEAPVTEEDGDLSIPALDSQDFVFSPEEDLVPGDSEPDLGTAFESTLDLDMPGSQELDLDPGQGTDTLDLDLGEDFPLGAEADTEEGVFGADMGMAPEPIDIDLELEQESASAAYSGSTASGPIPALSRGSARDQGDDELVSLSEDELDNILGDLDEEGEAAEGQEAEAEAEIPSGGFDESSELEEQGALAEEESPELQFSDEELGREVLGGEERPISILDGDEDESITLTAAELSNIVSTEAVPAEPEEVDFGSMPELDTSFATAAEDEPPVSNGEASFFHDDEEEGPLALTDDELADILEGTTVETEVAPEPRAERMADELSMETGLKREELKQIIGYLDDLLGQLPEETVREFSRSEYFNLYKKVIEDLGIYQ